MNFSESFKKAVTANKMINMELTPEFLVPNLYEYSGSDPLSEDNSILPLYILAGGNIRADFPFSFTFHSLNCYLLLYTTKGGGRIAFNNQTCTVTEGQLLFFDCTKPFQLSSYMLPWHFKLFFVSGSDMSLFAPILKGAAEPCFNISQFSTVSNCTSDLLALNTKPNRVEQLTMHRALTEILCELCRALADEAPAPVVPSSAGYLSEMWDHFERHYMNEFSLESFEKQFDISRYRLCREFSATYGMPPQKYLTNKRLNEAKKLLLNTDWTVHEISSRVGYENVNHFINLFKKYIGLTPNSFRRMARTEQSASHCSVQLIFQEA